MLKEFIALKTFLSFIIPYIILYSLYIQLNGEVSPGGGFQAGVIFASGLIGYELVFGARSYFKKISEKTLIISAVSGVLIYASVGVISLIFNSNYLNYNSIAENGVTGQHIGIFVIELGVGITVAAVMCLIYMTLKKDD